jgi:hypothetical protein
MMGRSLARPAAAAELIPDMLFHDDGDKIMSGTLQHVGEPPAQPLLVKQRGP